MNLKNEKVLYELKPDIRVAFISTSPIYIFIIIFFLLPFLGISSAFALALDPSFLSIIFIAILPLLFFSIAPVISYFQIKNISYTVTTARIIIRKGIFTRSEKSIPYKQIRNVELYKGIFDRLFNRSTLRFFSGEVGVSHYSTTDAIAHIENGEVVHAKILELIHS